MGSQYGGGGLWFSFPPNFFTVKFRIDNEPGKEHSVHVVDISLILNSYWLGSPRADGARDIIGVPGRPFKLDLQIFTCSSPFSLTLFQSLCPCVLVHSKSSAKEKNEAEKRTVDVYGVTA